MYKNVSINFCSWGVLRFLTRVEANLDKGAKSRPTPLGTFQTASQNKKLKNTFDKCCCCPLVNIGDVMVGGFAYKGKIVLFMKSMTGASSGACLGHRLGHVWGIIWRHVWCIIWGMSGASSGACLEHVWGFIWGMSGASSVGMSGSLRYSRCYKHLWSRFFINETMQCLLSYSDDEHRDKYKDKNKINLCINMTKTMKNLGFNLVNQNSGLLSFLLRWFLHIFRLWKKCPTLSIGV